MIAKTRLKLILIWAAILSVILLGLHFWNNPAEEYVEIEESAVSFPTMSTVATVKFWGRNDQIDLAVQEVRAAFEEVSAICNVFDPKSELARLNRKAAKKPFQCSPELWKILSETRKFHKLSGGLFDPSIRPMMHLWGFYSRRNSLPKPDEIRIVLTKCGMDKIIFNDEKRTVFFREHGISLDLGGIAKGWAVDCAVDRVLRRTEIRRGVVDLGGNIRCLPEPPPEKKFYTIGIRHPVKDGLIGEISLLDESISTSGNYERYVVIGGKRYTHIMNPKTGMPVSGDILSASVVTRRAVEADALSTCVFIGGQKFAETLLPATRSLLIGDMVDGGLKWNPVGKGWVLNSVAGGMEH